MFWVVQSLTFMSLADASTALYGTVGDVTMTDALYSCSKRWLNTSMCSRPRNPSLRETGREKFTLTPTRLSDELKTEV